MSERIPLLDPESAPASVKETFAAVKAKIGMVPNLYRVLGQSAAALNAYLGLGKALETASLELPLREKIALAVSQKNGCAYCLSAHSAVAKMAGVSAEAIREARA
ncbi:MAG: carboxymuconolactone decarboxylase family protein, partial [Deltaproteobacteria bacterium]|nr:carboxymuconolactone decarboxylase family protein [Deltaproteobacteria bacterium]